MKQLVAIARKHSANAAWVLADQSAMPLLYLVLTPFLISSLGTAGFGLWILGVTVVGMSQLISLGAGIATTKHVSADLASNARASAVTVTRAATLIAATGGVIAVLSALLAAPLLARVVFEAMGSEHSVASLLVMACAAAAIQELDGVYSGALRGAERFDLSAKVEIPTRIVMGIVLSNIAVQTGAVAPVFVAFIALLAAKAALKAWVVSRLFEDARCWLPSAERAPLRRVADFGRWQWLQATGSALFVSMDQLLVGGLLGAQALARYSICLQLAQYVHSIPAVAMQIVFPRVSALGRQLDLEARRALLRSTTLIAFAMAAAIGLVLIAFSYPILSAWIDAQFAAENRGLLVLLVVVNAAVALNIGAYFILLGLGRVSTSARIGLLSAVAQMIAATLFAGFGLIAFACNRFVYALGTLFLYRAAAQPDIKER